MSEVALLWHMHQPLYKGADGLFVMPWLFLHAIKDYYDMPWLLAKSGAKATFNITPTLLLQLQAYIDEGFAADRFLWLWRKEPSSLTSDERSFVLKVCKSLQFETMVKPLPHLAKLYAQKEYSDAQLLDFEVLFMLAWCGNYLRQSSSIVQKLLQQSTFTQKEKESLLEELFGFLPTILPYYRQLAQKGVIAISTTPYTHPILPLLLDMQNAKRANSATTLPHNPLRLREDALLHIQRAKELYEEHFGMPPRGFWPAEGAVDEESIALYHEANIAWIATDEAILHKSGFEDISRLYSFAGVKILFRHHALSDKIGFAYRYWDAEAAAKDFFDSCFANGITCVILDGENPWEYYPNNGKDFLERLYAKIASCSITMEEASTKEAQQLPNIAPGSWIYGNFDTWVGDEEKNRAWELLYQSKRDLFHHQKSERITEHFLAAECSDWFWWYGKGHYTGFAKEFDRLFRSHLIAIYKLADLPVPTDLLLPIVGKHSLQAYISEPKAPLTPVIDGRVTSFFEWLGAGMVDESVASTMDGVQKPIERLFWAEDGRYYYFRLDGEIEEIEVKIFFDDEEVVPKFLQKDEIIELAVQKPSRMVEVRIEVLRGQKVVQIIPSLTRLTITPQLDYAQNWFV